MRLPRVFLTGVLLGLLPRGAAGEETVSTSERICGTWVLQQVSSQAELDRLVPETISPALQTPHVRGFCLRVPWRAIDRDFSLLEAGRDLAQRHGVNYSVRFMAGRHTPERVFDKGARFYLLPATGRPDAGAEKVPAPFLSDGSPNVVFENEYEQFVERLASWCRENDVHLLHLAWYGQHWAELNHGKEVRALEGYSFDNWLRAHIRLIDIGLKYAGDDSAVELPFSGYGPLTEAASRFADHIVATLGPDSQKFYCQANGWGPRGDWGAPSEETETGFDRVWQKPVGPGQQAIQPSDFPWPQLFEKLYQNRATYCEVYAPSFLGRNCAALAEEIPKFAGHCREGHSIRQQPQSSMAEPAASDPQQLGEPPRLLDRPYVPLMTLIGAGPPSHVPSDEELATFAKTYQFVNSHGGMVQPDDVRRRVTAFWAGPSGGVDEKGRTIGERIKAFNPEFTLSNYRNGSYVSQNCPNEAAEVETRFPLGIDVWDTGTTPDRAISPDENTILVSRTHAIPSGMPQVYPFKASTTRAEHSTTPRDYVAWLRLGDEIMRIESARVFGADAIEMRVRRGLWGTKATAHGTEEPVLQPIYVGANQGIAAADGYLSGRPNTDAPQLGLRYALDQSNPECHQWLGDKCAVIFSEGYDVVWLDVSVSTWYNNANAYGTPVVPWDVERSRPMNNATYCERQQIKLDALIKRFPDKQFFVNNVKGNCYFDQGQERRLLSGAGGHHPASGGSMEMYANTRDEGAWRQVADMTLDFARSGFWGVAWSKGGGGSRYRQFAYGTFLLAYDPGSRLLFGAGFGGVGSQPDELFYWSLGKPLQEFRRIDEARHETVDGLYCRDFTQGKVFVNPTNRISMTVRLPREYYDPDLNRTVKEIQLAPLSAKILLSPPTS